MARRVLLLATSIAGFAVALSAAGEERAFAFTHDGTYTQTTFDLGVRWMPHVPSLTYGGDDGTTFGRTVPKKNLAAGDAQSFLGAKLDYEVVVDDHTRIPLIGAFFGFTVGKAPGVWSADDGTLARVDAWKSWYASLLLPGLGFRMKRRRWMFAASVRFGVSFVFGKAELAYGATSSEASVSRVSAAVIGDLEVCRRLDPIDRACLYAAPALYEFSALNGATFGLRWEWGL